MTSNTHVNGPRPDTLQAAVIVAFARAGTPSSDRARALVCAEYWPRVYAFVRRKFGADGADDLTQGFFTRLLQKNDVARVDPALGRFRNWLFKAAYRYCIGEKKKAHAPSCWLGEPLLSIDAVDTKGRKCVQPMHALNPERIYEQSQALALLEQTRSALRDEYVKDGQAPLFDKLYLCLLGWDEQKHEVMAKELGILRVNTFNVHVVRFKKRFRAILRDTFAQSGSSEAEIEEELCYLVEVLRSR